MSEWIWRLKRYVAGKVLSFPLADITKPMNKLLHINLVEVPTESYLWVICELCNSELNKQIEPSCSMGRAIQTLLHMGSMEGWSFQWFRRPRDIAGIADIYCVWVVVKLLSKAWDLLPHSRFFLMDSGEGPIFLSLWPPTVLRTDGFYCSHPWV